MKDAIKMVFDKIYLDKKQLNYAPYQGAYRLSEVFKQFLKFIKG
jgi:hypothetical protein